MTIHASSIIFDSEDSYFAKLAPLFLNISTEKGAHTLMSATRLQRPSHERMLPVINVSAETALPIRPG